MRKISKYIISIMTVLVLVFNTAIIPAMNVQASSTGMLYGLSSLLESLLFSAGMSCMGYSSVKMDRSDDSYMSLKKAMSMGTEFEEYAKQLDELDSSGKVDSLEAGETLDLGDVKIMKDASGINRVYASRALVQSAADSIKSWAESDENQYTTSASTSLEDSFNITYSNYVHRAFSSINDIADYYSADVVKSIKDLGYDDSNCMVVRKGFTYYASFWENHHSVEYVLSGSLPSSDGLYDAFIIVPFGNSFVDLYASNYYSNVPVSSSRGSCGSLFSTEKLCNYKKYYDNYGGAKAYSMLMKYRSDFDVVVYSPITEEITSFSYAGNTNYPPYWNDSDPMDIFNFTKAFENNSFFIYSLNLGSSPIQVQSLDTIAHYIKAGSGSKYANTEDFVSMEFDATTAESLASYSSLAEYMAYAASLSEQLSGIKDAIEDSTEQNAAQAKEIVSSINAQTDTLSDGIADVITTVKVQTDAINDVLEATKEQTDAIGDVITGIDDAALAITGPLEDILEAVRDIAITIPSDLTLTIPEEKLNITVQVPDISTEVINNIEVKYDYPALQKTIAAAIAAPLEAAFVPDEDKVYVFVDDFHHKFGFVDDMKKNVENIQKYIFGVTPSPILKIPIMKVKSKYDYGFGDYFIIDISWYEPYRPYGDLIILAFAWLMFIWRGFVSLPGIISGAPGSIWNSTSSIGTQPGIGMNDSNLIEDKRRK